MPRYLLIYCKVFLFSSGAGESGAAATDEISFLGTREIDGTPRVPRAIFDERTTLSGRKISFSFDYCN